MKRLKYPYIGDARKNFSHFIFHGFFLSVFLLHLRARDVVNIPHSFVFIFDITPQGVFSLPICVRRDTFWDEGLEVLEVLRHRARAEIMYNDNIAYFDLYAGLYMGYLITFLEDFAEVIRNKIPMRDFGGNPHQMFTEMPVMFQWIKLILDSISKT